MTAAIQAQIQEQSRQDARLSKMEEEIGHAQQRGLQRLEQSSAERPPGNQPKDPAGAKCENKVVGDRAFRNSMPDASGATPLASPVLPAERRSSCPAQAAVSMITPITDPPKLDLDRYTEWKEIIRFWSDVQGGIPGSQLVAKLALSSEGALGILPTQYLRDSAGRPDARNLEEAIALADKEFDRPAQEATMIAVNQMMNIQREPNENLRI